MAIPKRLRPYFSKESLPGWIPLIIDLFKWGYKGVDAWGNAEFIGARRWDMQVGDIVSFVWNSPILALAGLCWLAFVGLRRPLSPSDNSEHQDRGRLLSSLSALQSEGVWLQTEIDNGNITTDYQWAVCDGIIVSWFRSIKRTLEAWGENDKSRLFGLEGLPAFPVSTGSQENKIRAMREQIRRIDGQIAAVFRDIEAHMPKT